jgi:uncharacterized protein YcfJ
MKTFPALTVTMALAVGAAGAIATSADARSCRAAHHSGRTGAVVGAIAGGLLGNAVSHGGGRTGGTIIGAGAGAVAGHQIGKHSVKCGPRRRHHR